MNLDLAILPRFDCQAEGAIQFNCLASLSAEGAIQLNCLAFLSAEGAKNVSGPWLPPLRECGSRNLAFR